MPETNLKGANKAMYQVRIFKETKCIDKEFFDDIFDAENYAKVHTLNSKKRAYLEEFYQVHRDGKTYTVQSSICAIYKYGQIVGVM